MRKILRTKYRLAFMELPECVVAVDEDDERDEVDDKKPDDCPPGGSPLVFADLALHLARALSPPGPGSAVLHRPGARQPLSHPPGHVLAEGGDGEDD